MSPNDGTPYKTGYQFCEVLKAQTAGLTNTTIWVIPPGTLVKDVWVRVLTAGNGNTTDYITVGDEDDEDGFIAGFDPNSAAGTIIGDDPTERGAYLYDGTKKALCGKYYSASKNMIVDCEVVTSLTTNPIFEVIVSGIRINPN
jgi:hypothetical protein